MKDIERRLYSDRKCEYLLNDAERTAWIIRGSRIGRRRRYRVPNTVDVGGVAYKINSIEIGAFRNAKCLKHLVIPDSIEFVDEHNFSSSPSLRSIYIGKGLKNISSWIFQGNNRLRTFVISKENPYLYIEKGIIYTADGKSALTTPFCIKHLKLKEGVEVIANVAFWSNPNLKTVSFPSTLKSIGDNSFADCPKLKSLVFPEGFESLTSQCFWDCTGLETVDLPSTLVDMDYETFYGCSNLKTVIIRTNHVMEPRTFMKSPICLPKGCLLKVPQNLAREYRVHPLWGGVVKLHG